MREPTEKSAKLMRDEVLQKDITALCKRPARKWLVDFVISTIKEAPLAQRNSLWSICFSWPHSTIFLIAQFSLSLTPELLVTALRKAGLLP
jgi:hypothetical protein